jgi:pantetheine-phosphate adenylyltransferase
MECDDDTQIKSFTGRACSMTNNPSQIALYPGTFDSLTYGHLDIIQRASRLFKEIYVAVAHNEDKTPIFSVEERVTILREETAPMPNVRITSFYGLTVDYAEKIGAGCIIRGVRMISDFEYELQMALMNRFLHPRVETLFMIPAAQYLHVSSSLIKEVMILGGDVKKFVPPSTERCLRAKLNIPEKDPVT